MPTEAGSWASSLSRKLVAVIAAELRADETVLWVGRPGLELPGGVLWSRLFVFFVLGLVASAVAIATNGWLEIAAAIIAVLSWLLVAGGLALPRLWRLGVVQRGCSYVLTNQRAIVCHRRAARFRVELRSFPPADLGEITCVERENGSGDLLFGPATDDPVSLRDGFIGIDRVREVETLVRATLRLG